LEEISKVLRIDGTLIREHFPYQNLSAQMILSHEIKFFFSFFDDLFCLLIVDESVT